MSKNLWHWRMLRFSERNHEKHGQIIIGIGQMLRAKATTSLTWT
jgi:hypothetical protein